MDYSKTKPRSSSYSAESSSTQRSSRVPEHELSPYAYGPGLLLSEYGNSAVQELMRDNPESEAWDFYANAMTATDEDLQNQISSWRQTKEGTCATVAVSKAATDAMGTRAFKEILPTPEGFKVTLRDGTEVNLSVQELEEAMAVSAFKGTNDAALAFGTLQYAVTADQALEAGHENAENYSDALGALNNGESPNRVAGFQGLQDDMVGISSQQLMPQSTSSAFGGRDSVVAWSRKHAVFADKASSGHTVDHYGRGERYNGTDTNGDYRRRDRGNNIVKAFSFKKDDGKR